MTGATAAPPVGSRGCLSAAEILANFTDAHPPLTPAQARIEAARCYFCHDAPCLEACPTGIDIPGFIRAIGTGNLRGAALTILEQNIMGGTCARVCPTEILCEGACVRTHQEAKPVTIGALQRHATDALFASRAQPFTAGPPTGKRVAVVGAGPAGLACAHALARLGHAVTVIEARPKPGGLNEYGIAAYKMADDFAQAEVDFILGVGGITLETGKSLGRDVTLAALRRDYDAVFLGLGHNAVNSLETEGETLAGVRPAVDFIAELRQTADKSTLPVGRRVVVIGGGNTAVDAATQARRLGAEDVTIVYRRGPARMSATPVEQDWAQTNGVRIKHWVAPKRLIGSGGKVEAIELAYTTPDRAGETVTLPADTVLTAIGQGFVPDPLVCDSHQPLALDRGRIQVDDHRATSLPGVFAGGDCVHGIDLTVAAVEDGKIAARAIHRFLSA